MKNLLVLLGMVGLLAFTASMAFGTGATIAVPWYVNDFGGEMGSDWDTWLVCKNVWSAPITLTVDYYDNSDYTTIATSETVLLASGAVNSLYTGTPANCTFGYCMGKNADRGSIILRWPTPSGNAKAEMQGFVNLLDLFNGTAAGVNFLYK